jgi:prepilin-type N-terminal cleavage/methylation domain-containing protein
MQNKKGFTLIELLVAVVIIGILAAIALPKYTLAVERSRASYMQILAKNITYAANACWLVNGKDGKLCGPDQLDIEIYDKNGKKITNANISRSNSSPTAVTDYIGLAWDSSGVFYIVRTPYAGKWFFDIIISPSQSNGCVVRTNGSHPDGIKLAEALGYNVPATGGSWRWSLCF